MLIKISNGAPEGYPVLEENFRQLFPNVSFPSLLTSDVVEEYGYGLYEFSAQPEPGKYQKVVEGAPVKSEDGVWVQSWQVIEKSAEEKAEEDAKQEDSMRGKRRALLTACDWTQLPDSPVDASEWLAYRQSLRDVPSQPGFPWNIVWPQPPFPLGVIWPGDEP